MCLKMSFCPSGAQAQRLLAPLRTIARVAMLRRMAFLPLGTPCDANNAFAPIIRGEEPASLVYRTPGEMGHALDVTRWVAVVQQRTLGATDFSILGNNGRDQAVGHVHFHVVPNTPADPQTNLSRDQLGDMAARLAAAFPMGS